MRPWHYAMLVRATSQARCDRIQAIFANIAVLIGLAEPVLGKWAAPAYWYIDRARLRLIALSHDTFKYAEDRSRPRDWARHHGVLARRFIEHYTDDPFVLDIIETHDDAYYAWLGSRPGCTAPGARSLVGLLHRVGHCLQLYYLFFKCDTQTGDKVQASLKWFEKNVLGIEYVKVREG